MPEPQDIVETPEQVAPEEVQVQETAPEGFSLSEEPFEKPPEGFVFSNDPPVLAGDLEQPDSLSSGQKAWRRFWGSDVNDQNEMSRMGGVAAGAIGGAYAGSKTPWAKGPLGIIINPVNGSIVLGLTGAAAGALAPEAVMEAGEQLGLLEPGYRATYGLSDADLRTVLEGEVLLELYTAGGISALRLGARGLTSLVANPSREIAEAGARQNIMLMPVQVGNRLLGRGYVAVLGRFPLVGSPFRKVGQKAERDYEKAVSSLGERVARVADWSDVSDEIYSDATTLLKQTSDHFDKKYTEFWARADAAGVRIIPAQTLEKADEILEEIAQRTPKTLAQIEGDAVDGASAGVALDIVKDFIEKEIIPLGRQGTESGVRRVMAIQTLAEADGLISKIDQKLLSLEPGQKRVAQHWLSRLRTAIKMDVTNNMRGPNSHQIIQEMKELDTEFSTTISQLFETSTAKSFGSVRKRGLRAVEFDDTTRVAVDQLARHVVKLDSPQAMEELSRIVTPETFSRVTARVMDDAVTRSRVPVDRSGFAVSGDSIATYSLEMERFAKHLGLEGLNTNRRQSIEMMLKQSNAPYTIKDLEDLVTVGKAIESLPIPDVSTFVARRAVIGGMRSALTSFIPGAALIAVSGGVTGMAGGALSTVTFFLGARGLASALANPNSARSLFKVLDREASMLTRRKAMLQTARLTFATMRQDGLISDADELQLWDAAQEATGAFFEQIESFIGEDAEKKGA